jgi:superfamily II DNA/RNA helicase
MLGNRRALQDRQPGQFQILDEGDKMLDMGFEQDILEIQKFLTREEGTRSMIFSATVPGFI